MLLSFFTLKCDQLQTTVPNQQKDTGQLLLIHLNFSQWVNWQPILIY